MSNPDTKTSEDINIKSENRSLGVRASIFKAYDVRGIYPEEINKDTAYKIGLATAKFLQTSNPGKKLNIVIGEDARLASPALRGAIVDAITKAGANVIYIGQCTTPLFYFSVNQLKADGGIMATASHNPAQYGGLKIVGLESRPIGAETGLKEIESLSAGEFKLSQDVGNFEEKNIVSDYIDFLINTSKINKNADKLKIVIDTGNGMKPLVIEPLMAKLGFSFIPLYFEIDCSFPNHSPDISKKEALEELKKRVVDSSADLGVAFDGDGDRVMFVDEKGEIVKAEYVLALLYKDASSFLHKPKVVYDIRISKSVKELLSSRGIKSRPGHSFMKKVMRENHADIGGELSGHFFFKEMKYAESSALVMLKIMEILHDSASSMSELIKPFQKYFNSGEINIEIQNREDGLTTVNQLKNKYKDGKIDEMDGIMVEYLDWWFNLRLSNTEPIVRLVVEADTKEVLDKKVAELISEIKKPA